MSSPLNDALGNAWRVVIDKALKKEKRMDIKPRPTLKQIVERAESHVAYGWSRSPGSISGETEWWDEDVALYDRAYGEAKEMRDANHTSNVSADLLNALKGLVTIPAFNSALRSSGAQKELLRAFEAIEKAESKLK